MEVKQTVHTLKASADMFFVKAFFLNDGGVTAIEYVFVGALIAAAIILALTSLGTSLKAPFSNVGITIPQTIS